VTEARARPAFYALAPGGWRDYVTLLHPPYTAWHLSYVVIGACLAPTLYEGRLAATAAAFFLALGISAHAIDELKGRPLQTKIPRRVLVVLSIVPLVGAVAIGIGGAIAIDPWLLVFVAVGTALVPVYNLELFGGAIHNGAGFALAWGAFPVLTAFVAQTGTLRLEAVLAAVWATILSLAQRQLSTPVRRLRREAASIDGQIVLGDGSRVVLTRQSLVGPSENALRLLAASAVLVAAVLVALRA